ncbi:MAG: ZIP family metal transporter [Clostridia bacterium]|nr:ZIP family metal transporter [Clostridia bacterium]
MTDFFIKLDPTVQAVIATLFTWAVTALGACVVFLFKNINKSIMDATLGCAAGVMIAASFWSLLAPSIEMAEDLGSNPWITVLIGFMLGGIVLFLGDKFFEKRMKNSVSDSKKRVMMLIFSITLHNIPEGMAVGVAFGSLAYGLEGATLGGAVMLAIGIGLQNFPEGSAVSLPLLREGYSPRKAFILGQFSGIVEPISGFLGAVLVLKARFLLPYLLAFAAGAMIYVVVEELIPESQTNQRKDLMALFTLIGFSIMMVMDVALG